MAGENDCADCTIRVRYAETDQMGVAYYASYFVWFEVGRSAFCRKRGFSYQDMERETESFLAVAEAHCRYRLPLRYDNEFLIRTCLKELRRRTVIFSYQLLDQRAETVYAEGETTHVVTDREGKSKSMPEHYRRFLAGITDTAGRNGAFDAVEKPGS